MHEIADGRKMKKSISSIFGSQAKIINSRFSQTLIMIWQDEKYVLCR